MTAVNATVRLQFHQGFTLDDAVTLVPYFKRLGISHIYASPLLKARAGSMHGYDVVDPSCINPELGGEPALERLVTALREHQMGLIVDIVCNHMAVGKDDNPWWLDVLQWGLKSPYARYFDIQWNSPDPLLKGQLLLPFLSGNYGEVLAAGDITLHFDSQSGEFFAKHYDHKFPIYPPSYGHILRHAKHPALQPFIRLFEALETAEKDEERSQDAKVLHKQLGTLAQNEAVAESIAEAIKAYDVSIHETAVHETAVSEKQAALETTAHDDHLVRDEHSGDLHPDWQHNENLQRLHELLELQHYRLASWRTASDDINWRRFFDVNELAGLRIERSEVFEASHGKIFELVAKGWIDGLRIDHVDGLANPRAYCRKLRRRLDNLHAQRPPELAQDHMPIYVEKILADKEKLNTSWRTDGTTGYEFMNQVSLLQHDPRGELQLFDLWTRISGRQGTFKDEAREARRLVLASSLAGDVETVAQGLLQIARTDIATRDLPLGAIRRALIEIVVHFPVYRTYANACGRAEQDQIYFNEALTGARQSLAESDWPILDYLEPWLGGLALHALPPGPIRNLRKKTIARFQQLTSPAAAKAVEDTACYRSAVLLSRNDVGFDPQNFSAPLSQFHEQNRERALYFPANLLATATHDHKRGEDTRARIAVISERSVWFAGKLEQWQALSTPLKTTLDDGVAPSPGDEIMLYQVLLGTWPLSLMETDAVNSETIQHYLERMLRWQEKALREAKLRTSWSAPNGAYETANQEFLTHLLTAADMKPLRDDIINSAASLAPAGALNGLTQTLLRMTAPGIPDLYQGCEFWDFSLVDPDNRQPVDFGARVAALSSNLGADSSSQPDLSELMSLWRDGRIKQWLIAATLRLRHQYHTLFSTGDYQQLVVEGECADQVVAFARLHEGRCLVVIAPRLCSNLLGDSTIPLVNPTAWGNTCVLFPPEVDESSKLVESLAPVNESLGSSCSVSELLAKSPINILIFEVGSDNKPAAPSFT
ncbi:MAG: malto-oligosyltrehalose synthase [Gammaproteobacteria bacterium]|nr:MAG: malto-oligosyltrehalose synthase [Gammaproteobacteria bacterium]